MSVRAESRTCLHTDKQSFISIRVANACLLHWHIENRPFDYAQGPVTERSPIAIGGSPKPSLTSLDSYRDSKEKEALNPECLANADIIKF